MEFSSHQHKHNTRTRARTHTRKRVGPSACLHRRLPLCVGGVGCSRLLKTCAALARNMQQAIGGVPAHLLAPAQHSTPGSPLAPHLHRDWARSCHICTHRDWAHPCHICTGTGLTPATPGPRLALRCGVGAAVGGRLGLDASTGSLQKLRWALALQCVYTRCALRTVCGAVASRMLAVHAAR